LLALLLTVSGVLIVTQSAQKGALRLVGFRFDTAQKGQPEKLSSSEFSKLINEISEEGGYFRSDNFTSNETSYLHVVSRLSQLGASGGAYVGVGPEQNFTYIAKVRPRIAFIIDIRRQAMIQHLMFKAIFHMAPTRVQYLSVLLSKPLPKEKVPGADAPTADIVSFIHELPRDDKFSETNLAAIRKAIREDFNVQLTDSDQASLDYVFKSFRAEGLDIAYRVEGMRGGGWFPTFRELILQPDQFGKPGNFLASREDYEYVREMHRRNMIIPVVGDFAGKKALAAIGDYLKKNNFTLSAFYVSNVEQYLFQGGVFPAFVDNVRRLPINERSHFIRAVPNTRFSHPARVPGHMITTLLQQVPVFLKDFDQGLYPGYNELVTTHYIAGEMPPQ
jgi:hypothetical protein